MDARLVDLTMRYYATIEAERDAAHVEYRREEAWRRRAAANGRQSFYHSLLGAHLSRVTSGRVALSTVTDAEYERCRLAVVENYRQEYADCLCRLV